jgi:hypothetical protein
MSGPMLLLAHQPPAQAVISTGTIGGSVRSMLICTSKTSLAESGFANFWADHLSQEKG